MKQTSVSAPQLAPSQAASEAAAFITVLAFLGLALAIGWD